MRRIAPGLLSLLVALGVGVPLPALAQAPELISYQGLLSLPGGQVVPDGDYDLVFRIFEEPEPPPIADAPLFEQTIHLTIVNGLYNVVLSSQPQFDLSDAFGGPNRFMELTIGSGPPELSVGTPLTLLPRQRIASVPYALGASSAGSSGDILRTAVSEAESTATDSIPHSQWLDVPNLSVDVTVPSDGAWALKADALVQVQATSNGSPEVAARLVRSENAGPTIERWSSAIELMSPDAPTSASLSLRDSDTATVQAGSTYTYTVQVRCEDTSGQPALNGMTSVPGYTRTSYLKAWAEKVSD